MEIDKIIQYLLIGNLINGKIIYEMQNTNDINIIYEIKHLFSTYSIKHNLSQENIKVESYYINISSDKLIMISKTSASFSIEQNLELFEKIKKNIPDLINYPLNQLIKKKKEKQSLESKITNIIYDYFQYVNANKQIVSEAYFKYNLQNSNIIHFPKKIIHKNNDKDNKIYSKHNQITNLITEDNTKNIDIDKSSNRHILKEGNYSINLGRNKMTDLNKNQYKGKNNDKLNELELNKNKEEEEDYTNIIKILNQSRILFEMTNNNNIMNFKSNQIINNTNSNNYKNRKKVILVLIIVILVQIIAIPLIIINSYSY